MVFWFVLKPDLVTASLVFCVTAPAASKETVLVCNSCHGQLISASGDGTPSQAQKPRADTSWRRHSPIAALRKSNIPVDGRRVWTCSEHCGPECGRMSKLCQHFSGVHFSTLRTTDHWYWRTPSEPDRFLHLVYVAEGLIWRGHKLCHHYWWWGGHLVQTIE